MQRIALPASSERLPPVPATLVARTSRLPMDRGQQIVEVVSHAAGQLADRLHLNAW